MSTELTSLSGRNSYGVVAGRRAGKSSLLIALEDNLLRRHTRTEDPSLHVLPVFFSLKNLQFEKPGDIFGFALHRLRVATSGVRKGPPFDSHPSILGLSDYAQHNASTATLQDLEAGIEDVITRAYTRFGPARIVFLVDEMDEILELPWTSMFFGNLRSLIYDGPVKEFVRLVVAGSGRYVEVDEKGSQLFNAIKPLFLEPFDEDGINELLQRSGKVEPGVAAEVVNQAGGHPFILQHILYYLFERGIERAVLEDVATEVRRFVFERAVDLNGWWNAIGEDGRLVYCALRASKNWKTVSDLGRGVNEFKLQSDRGFKTLCYHGLVTHDGTYRRYRFKGHLFRDWTASRCREQVSATRKEISLNENATGDKSPRPSALQNTDRRAPVKTVKPTRKKVFISYSHKDKRLFEEFKTMLAPAIRNGIVDLWDDTRIAAGSKWRDEIDAALSSAKVAVLLVSQHFLASDFIAKHELSPLIEAAQTEGVIVIWIYLSSCLYEETEITKYQAGHDISKPLDRLDKPARQAVLSQVCKNIIELAQNPA
ncbi:MAG TPA: TIR domain-containing protein [Pyrinomonadaceae bacterium]|nr:TIR domain-containing protein [Pyrinomonadaceae bacterium]